MIHKADLKKDKPFEPTPAPPPRLAFKVFGDAGAWLAVLMCAIGPQRQPRRRYRYANFKFGRN